MSDELGYEVGETRADPRPLGYLLRQAAAAHRLRMERALADIEVTPPQMLVMTMLAVHTEQSSADIARRAALTPPTVSVIVANLERRGSVTRKPHPIHGRVQHLELTPSGRSLLKSCQERADAVEKDIDAGISTEEAVVIRRWLLNACRQA